MTKRFYDVLGVGLDATNIDLRNAFRREALKWHPDKNPTRVQEATERFKLIAQAYAALSDSAKTCSGSRSHAGTSFFSDSRFGFCNQCAGRPDMRCSSCGSSGWSMDAAAGLFREIFEEDIRDVLGKLGGAAVHVATKAASQAGKVATQLAAIGQSLADSLFLRTVINLSGHVASVRRQIDHHEEQTETALADCTDVDFVDW
eukprot:CAMPEP_0169167686 /NCGR_PEP_ID=MMETSP1015-20121227/60606_1 /TAXON_ID=342587 /ORGANISM="Karlodinium micrum, Strain CCMP2283" /LENGTH=201 /DNA_ID=CAMNT_0009240417 /DNA_START=56 /DNA_END=662 /DNA_ORIENTATION=+